MIYSVDMKYWGYLGITQESDELFAFRWAKEEKDLPYSGVKVTSNDIYSPFKLLDNIGLSDFTIEKLGNDFVKALEKLERVDNNYKIYLLRRIFRGYDFIYDMPDTVVERNIEFVRQLSPRGHMRIIEIGLDNFKYFVLDFTNVSEKVVSDFINEYLRLMYIVLDYRMLKITPIIIKKVVNNQLIVKVGFDVEVKRGADVPYGCYRLADWVAKNMNI